MSEQKYFWNEEQLRIAVTSCDCRHDVARMLCPGVEPRIIAKRLIRQIKSLSLDTSHWVGSAKSGIGKRRPTSELFVLDSRVDRAVIRRRILQASLIPYRCAICDEYQWNGQPLSLQVDHINGDKWDHRLNNLRLLCPNCHSQTSTYAGKRENHSTNRAMCDILKAIETTHGKRIANKLREDI